MELITNLAWQWYQVLSQLSNWAGQPLQTLLGGSNIPAVSALLLGLIGGLAPCQMTANAGAVLYVTQAGDDRRSHWIVVRDFLAGKAGVYLLLGLLAGLLGLQMPIPVMAVLRKLSGPLLILIGLHLAGVLRTRGDAGERVTAWLRARAPKRGSPALWLGAAFSLGFCPTMALIFFGALVPLIIQADAGLVLPVIFAIGTSVPVLLWAAALSAGRGAAGRWLRQTRSLNRYLRPVIAVLFLLLGLNDLILYWLI